MLALLSHRPTNPDAGGANGDSAAVAAAAIAARRGSDYVPREQHEQLEVQLATVKTQLVECLEELNSRELELTEVRVCSSLFLWAVKVVALLVLGTHAKQPGLLRNAGADVLTTFPSSMCCVPADERSLPALPVRHGRAV